MFYQPSRISRLTSLAFVALLWTTGCGYAPITEALPGSTVDGILATTPASTVASGTVTGSIIDVTTKAGVPGVVVQVENVTPPVQATTDVSGNFVLSNVHQGTQVVVVNKAGYVYVATQGSIQVNVIANQTIALPTINLSPQVAVASNAYLTSIGGLAEPYGLTVDNNHGFLYVVDRIGADFFNTIDKRSAVKKFTLTGGAVSSFGGDLIASEQGIGGILDRFDHLSWAYGIDVDTGGNVYVADTNNNRVVKFGADGSYLTKITDGVSNPYDVAVENSGQVAVSSGGNNTVGMFDVNLQATGTHLASSGSLASADGGFKGITIDNSSNIYLVDQSGGAGSAIKKYDKTGVLTVHFGNNGGAGTGQFSNATDIAVDSRDNDIYVVDEGNNRVQRFDMSGHFISEFGSAGTGNGQFDRPYGIAIDANGYVYVSDIGNKRIQKFAPGRLTNVVGSTSGYTTYPTN